MRTKFDIHVLTQLMFGEPRYKAEFNSIQAYNNRLGYCPSVLCCAFDFVFLRLVYHMLPVSLDCPFLIGPSVFSILTTIVLDIAHQNCQTC